jgi:hypothetical protein
MLRRIWITSCFGLCAAAQDNVSVSVSSAGALANKDSYYSLISSDGRYVAFQSDASNLAGSDFNGVQDIYWRDLQTGTTQLVSVGLTGLAAAGVSVAPCLSGDGRWVGWSTNASNVVPGDTNGTWDVFLRDMVLGITTRISLDFGGNQVSLRSDQPRITPDGNWVTFESDAALLPIDTNGLKDCYRLDRSTNTLALVSTSSTGTQGNGISYAAQPSHDGRYVVFFSSANNLVAGDTNNQGDVFWKDMLTGLLVRANVSAAGAQANNESIWPSVSGDGNTVTFCSVASNLVPGDTNSNWDVFARDIALGTTERLNVQPNGAQANSYVYSPTALSSNGRHVIFVSLSSNLVPGDTNGFQDVFIRDRLLVSTKRLSLAFDGSQTNKDAFVPDMTPDAQIITYTSTATNVVPGDTNGFRDIFVTYVADATVYCTAKVSSNGCVPSIGASGPASLANPGGFTITTSSLEDNQNGLSFFGISGPLALPFQGGTLCVNSPHFRLDVAGSGGAGACQGSLSYTLLDMLNQAGGGGAGLLAGTYAYVQTWFRDPAAASTTGWSNALEIAVQP